MPPDSLHDDVRRLRRAAAGQLGGGRGGVGQAPAKGALGVRGQCLALGRLHRDAALNYRQRLARQRSPAGTECLGKIQQGPAKEALGIGGARRAARRVEAVFRDGAFLTGRGCRRRADCRGLLSWRGGHRRRC